jgi:hypothetical protein
VQQQHPHRRTPTARSTTTAGAPPVNSQFNIVMASNLSNPDDVNSRQQSPGGTGTLTINDLNQLADGSFLAQYGLRISNGGGGTVIGTGAGKWT